MDSRHVPDTLLPIDELIERDRRRLGRRLILSGALVLGLMGLAAWKVFGLFEAPSLTVEEYSERATAFEGEGQVSAAIVALKIALQQAPKRPDLRFRLGRLYLATDDPRSAIKELERARALDYRSDELPLMLAEAHVVNAEPAHALSTLAQRSAIRWLTATEAVVSEAFRLEDASGETADLMLDLQASDGQVQIRATLDGAPWSGEPDPEAITGAGYRLRPDNPVPGRHFTNTTLTGQRGVLTVTDDALVYTLRLADEAHAGDLQAPRVAVLRGRALLGLDEVEAAESEFRRALALDARSAGARLGLAAVALRRDLHEEAEQEVDTALALEPESVDALRLKGELAAARKDHATAQQQFEHVIERRPRDASSRVSLGWALLAQGKLEEAGAQVGRLRKLAPNWAPALFLAARVAQERDDATGMRQALLEALRSDPGYGPALIFMGALHQRSGEPEQARELLRRFLAEHPGHPAGTMLLARVNLQMGHPDEAIAVLRTALRASPGSAELLLLLGEAYATSGAPALAAEYFAQAAQADPEDPAARFGLAWTELTKGDWQGGMTELKAAMELAPGAGSEGRLLFHLQLSRGDLEGAIETAQALAAKEPGSPLGDTLLGMAMRARGDLDKARRHFEAALARDPDYLSATMFLARMDQEAGNVAGARARYESILRSKSSASGATDSARMALAKLDLDSGDLDAAARHLDELLAREPDHRRALEGRSEVAYRQGDSRLAASLLEQIRAAHPREVLARKRLARYYRATGDRARLRAVVGELEALAATDPEVLRLVADVQRATGSADALASYERLVEQRPQDAQAHYDVGTVHVQRNEPEAARAAFSRALALDPAHRPSLLAMGVVEAATGNLGAAMTIAERLEREHPGDAGGLALKGDVLVASGRRREAQQAYRRALEIRPRGALFRRLVELQRSAGDIKAARATLGQWLAWPAAPVPELEDIAALAIRELSARNLARAAYERILEHQPEHAKALNNLAWLYDEASDTDRALSLAKRAHALDPANPAFADTYGWLLLRTGSPTLGLRLVEQALVGLPRNREVQYHVASGLVLNGQSERAWKILDDLLQAELSPALRAKVSELKRIAAHR